MGRKNSLINISPKLSNAAEEKLISVAEKAADSIVDTSARTVEKITDTIQEVKRMQVEKEQEEKRLAQEKEMESRRARRPIVLALTVIAVIALVYCLIGPVAQNRKGGFVVILAGVIIYLLKKI